MALQRSGRGYPVTFVEPPPKQMSVECIICLEVLFRPKMVPGCGHSFCAACISRVERDHKPCPLCNQEFSQAVNNKDLERTLNGFKVYCPHQEKGCEWIGELGELPRHLNQDPRSDELLVGCLFQEIRCGLCQAHSCERRLMNEHAFAQCPNRDIECEYRCVGCDVKKPQQQLESHGREAINLHLSLVTNFVRGNLSQKDNEIQELKEELSQERKQIRELKQQHTELKQQHTELKQQHIDLQGHTNRHWIVLLILLLSILLSGGMVYAYLYQTDLILLVDLNKLNTSMKEANVTLSSRLESLGFHQEQFKNSCMNVSNLTDLYSKILELNSSIQQMELKQDSKTGDVRQHFSKLLEIREAKEKSRDQQARNEIQALSEALERNVMDLKKIATMQILNLTDHVQKLNNSIQQMEMEQNSVKDKLKQEFSSLLQEREATERMRKQLQILSRDLKNLESAYKISTKQINESLKNLEKQILASGDEWRHEYNTCNSSSLSTNELQRYEQLKNPEKQLTATNNEQRHEHNSSANELQNENLDQQDLVDFPVLPVYLNMTDVKEHNASMSHWLSEPFYTHEGGYKMRLVVYLNGKYLGAGTQISVATYLMSGKYDDKLDWPANVMLIVTLLNRDSEDKDPIARLFDYPTSNSIFDRVWNSSMAKIGVIHSHFASRSTVVHSYIKHDSLYFHVDWIRREAKDKQRNYDNSWISTYSYWIKVYTEYAVHKITHYIITDLVYFGGDSDGSIIYCSIHTCYLSDSLFFFLDLTVDSLQ